MPNIPGLPNLPGVPGVPDGDDLRQASAQAKSRLAAAIEQARREAEGNAEGAQTKLEETGSAPNEAAAPHPGAGPVGQGDYVVKQGDCISSIAKDHGYFWQTLWDDPANAELKAIRKEPNILLPGDRVTLPTWLPKQEPGATEMRHRFVRHGEPEKLQVRLLRNDLPLADQPYELNVAGRIWSGVSDADGRIACAIPGNARRGKLIIGAGDKRQEYDLNLGEIDPLSAISGVQGRLNNLGFDCGAVDGLLGPRTRRALSEFQARLGLPETGQPDEATLAKLKGEHGS